MLAFITTFVAKKTRIQKLQRLLQLQNKSKETAVNLLDHRVYEYEMMRHVKTISIGEQRSNRTEKC